ncbi:hypothetical protein [Granulicoccus phenolivorans]|uniref:hypothetical protein n=1 Tax=Granulicoccus phenolivorans TaxID=266854 RepID=UPI0004070A52|nr:hypothetical protein [Granulicoccus phenolivorans]
MTEIIQNLSNQVATIGGALATLAFILLGIKAIVTFNKGGGLREVLSGGGVIFLGLMLIGAAGVLVGAIQAMAKALGA